MDRNRVYIMIRVSINGQGQDYGYGQHCDQGQVLILGLWLGLISKVKAKDYCQGYGSIKVRIRTLEL